MTRIKFVEIEHDGPGLGDVLRALGASLQAPTVSTELVTELEPVRALPPAPVAAEVESATPTSRISGKQLKSPGPRRVQKPKGITVGKGKVPRKAKATRDGGEAAAGKPDREQRTKEILARLARGQKAGKIADDLGVSVATVYGARHREKQAQGNGAQAKPAREPKPEAEDRPRIRCHNCGQYGYDPKRCEKCLEKR